MKENHEEFDHEVDESLQHEDKYAGSSLHHVPHGQRPGGDTAPVHNNMVEEAEVFYCAKAGIFEGEYAKSHTRGTGQMDGERLVIKTQVGG